MESDRGGQSSGYDLAAKLDTQKWVLVNEDNSKPPKALITENESDQSPSDLSPKKGGYKQSFRIDLKLDSFPDLSIEAPTSQKKSGVQTDPGSPGRGSAQLRPAAFYHPRRSRSPKQSPRVAQLLAPLHHPPQVVIQGEDDRNHLVGQAAVDAFPAMTSAISRITQGGLRPTVPKGRPSLAVRRRWQVPSAKGSNFLRQSLTPMELTGEPQFCSAESAEARAQSPDLNAFDTRWGRLVTDEPQILRRLLTDSEIDVIATPRGARSCFRPMQTETLDLEISPRR